MKYLYMFNGEGEPVSVSDVLVWGRWLETADRNVKRTDLGEFGLVSTVFLATDHAFGISSSKPVLWESMVFGGSLDGEQRRYYTREDALRGHLRIVRRLKARIHRTRARLVTLAARREQEQLALQPKARRVIDSY